MNDSVAPIVHLKHDGTELIRKVCRYDLDLDAWVLSGQLQLYSETLESGKVYNFVIPNGVRHVKLSNRFGFGWCLVLVDANLKPMGKAWLSVDEPTHLSQEFTF